MSQVEKSIEIKASPKQCYDVITDYENYPEFLKETTEVEVLKSSGNTAEVRFSINVIKKISYVLKMTGKPPHGLKWTFVKGDMMKDNKGEWVLEEIKKGVTLATYKIDIDLGLFVPGAISKMLIGNNLPAMLDSFKKRIEKKK